MHPSSPLYLGLDVHLDSSAVAEVANDHDAEVSYLGPLGTRPCDREQLARKRPANAQHLVCVYDAGPGGDWLYRYLTPNGYACWVVAPSVTPKQAGDRVNTDRRDAIPLARLMRSGELTPVSVPAVADDAMRDLSRARAATLPAVKTAELRLTACPRRPASRSTGRATWGPAHLRWLSEVVCPTPAQQIVFQEYVRAVTEHTERLHRLEQELHEHVKAWRLYPVVEALQARRGVQGTGAGTRLADLGALSRVDHPRPRMKALGLPPAEDARGARRRQGGRPKTGKTQARRARLEGAGAYRYPATVRRPRPRRREQLPKPRPDRGGKAQARRCTRDRPLSARGQPPHQGVVAMARELRALLWASAEQGPVTASRRRPPWRCRKPPHGVPEQRPLALGSGAAPVCCHPPAHYQGQPPRPARAASSRRTPVRWSPTHGEPPAQPALLTGSASSPARRRANLTQTSKSCDRLLTLAVISTL
jgi:transposase